MHYALPNRKGGDTVPPSSRYQPRISGNHDWASAVPRRQPLRLLLGLLVSLFILLIWLRGSSRDRAERGFVPGQGVVVVTTVDQENMSPLHLQMIRRNRQFFAQRHGYDLYMPDVSDFQLSGKQKRWGSIPSMRSAMTRFPHAGYVFFLAASALVMDQNVEIRERFFIDALTLQTPDLPVVSESVIHTVQHTDAEDIQLIVARDGVGLGGSVMLLRAGTWARYLLDVWYDPLLRGYNFERGETHALGHILQWHPTLTAHLSLIPQRLVNAYASQAEGSLKSKVLYQTGDFIVNAEGCELDKAHSCEEVLGPYSDTGYQ